MFLEGNAHLTYCTNIHPGESWEEVFDSLKKYTVEIKEQLQGDKPFGIGLRLSRRSAATLLRKNRLEDFKQWLHDHNLYVFTMNGFPYGDFHDAVIKDKVHLPDWTSVERVSYTQDLFKILSFLLPDAMEGGISTSPLSYRLWFKNKEEEIENVKKKCTSSLMKIVVQLFEIEKETGKHLHLDLEPEPDGFLENTEDIIRFFEDYLFHEGVEELMDPLKCSKAKAKAYILRYIQVCYDVCHFSLAYESTKYTVDELNRYGIKIGKIQISAALKCVYTSEEVLKEQQACLLQFDEPNYLHQAILKRESGELSHYSDLSEGVEAMEDYDFKEIRTHFHVPVFIEDYQVLQSTQDAIIEALTFWKENKYSNHLEVETYTWTILPKELQTDLTSSVVRELDWVLQQINA
ncbi:metabolite traffic protein EboE [Flavicella sediminum]|uniref:metabolite traffic protein EboE n=1 Tax=Flavicella sediminum TaxID=2585141 RepID=UPI001122A7AB|nr:metabolite traffic protein EboE [Flavicella sediminum]